MAAPKRLPMQALCLCLCLCLCLWVDPAAGAVPRIVARGNGVYVDGAPFLPAGYCNHAHMTAGGGGSHDRSYDQEVVNGFNSIFTYRGLPGTWPAHRVLTLPCSTTAPAWLRSCHLNL